MNCLYTPLFESVRHIITISVYKNSLERLFNPPAAGPWGADPRYPRYNRYPYHPPTCATVMSIARVRKFAESNEVSIEVLL